MYGKKRPRHKPVHHQDEAKMIAAQKKYVDMLIDNVRYYFTKLEEEHKELTSLQAIILANKLKSEHERRAGVSQPQKADESAAVNKIELNLASKFQGSEEEEDEESD